MNLHLSIRRLGLGPVAALFLGICGGCLAETDDSAQQFEGVGAVSLPPDPTVDTHIDSPCLAPDELDYLFPPTRLPEFDFFSNLVVDGEYIYARRAQRLLRIPLSAGEPEVLYYRDPGLTPRYFVREDDLLLVDGKVIQALPKAGGEPVDLGMLPEWPAGMSFATDGRTAFAKFEGPLEDDRQSSTYALIDLESLEVTTLASLDRSRHRGILRRGDSLFALADDPHFSTTDAISKSSALYRIPNDGSAPERIDPRFPGDSDDLLFGLGTVGTDPTALFLTAIVNSVSLDLFDPDRSGIYRVPLDGSPASLVIQDVPIFPGLVHYAKTAERNLINAGNDVHQLPIGSGDSQLAACFLGNNIHSIAGAGDTLYVSLFDREDRASIARVQLPPLQAE